MWEIRALRAFAAQMQEKFGSKFLHKQLFYLFTDDDNMNFIACYTLFS